MLSYEELRSEILEESHKCHKGDYYKNDLDYPAYSG